MKKEALLSKYRGFLEITLKNGVKTKKEMLDFIREEDKYYRAFLAQLYYMENEKLSGVNYLVQSNTLQNAVKNIEEVMNTGMQDWRIASVAETSILDVICNKVKK